MKKLLILCIFLTWPLLSRGQVMTSITATLQDSNGQVWANASYSISITPPFGNPAPLINQVRAPLTPVTGFADGAGNISLSLDDNTVITPTGSTWVFTICPNSTVQVCSTSIQVVHGTSMNLSSSLNADLTPVAVAASPTIKRGYIDSEVTGGQGAVYWRTSDNTLRGNNGSSWVPIGNGGGVLQPLWNNIQAPTGNLSLAMSNNSTMFNMGNATGSTGATFTINDTTSNTGTNYLFQVFTNTGSTAKVAAFCAQGTNNCIEFNASATLQALGSAIITATQVINTGPGIGIVQLGSNGSGSVSAGNTIKLTGNLNAAYISENGGTLSKVLLGGQLGCTANNLFQSVNTGGSNTCVSYGSVSAGPLFGITGSQFNTFANPAHFVKGQQALTAGTATVTLSGAAVFTSNLTYYCFGNDATAIEPVQIAPLSGTQFAINGTTTDLIHFICYGQ